MRSIAIALLVSLLVASTVKAQQNAYEKRDFRLHKVKRVTAVISYGSSVSSTFTSDYDRHGNLIKRTGYGEEGKPLIEWTYEYDDHDNMITYGGKKIASYTYDREGRVVAATKFDTQRGSVLERHTYQLNGDKVIEDDVLTPDGTLTERHISQYDKIGNLITYIEQKPDGSIVAKTVHTFNDESNATRSISYDAQGHVTSTVTYRYDGSGQRLVERTEVDVAGRVHKRNTYKRDTRGFVVEEIESNGSETTQITKSTWELYP